MSDNDPIAAKTEPEAVDSAEQAQSEPAEVESPEEQGQDAAAASNPSEPATPPSETSEPAAVVDQIGPEADEVIEAEPVADPLAEAQEENRKLREKVLRVAADFDNFRKRARRENEDGAKRARVELLRELLPVFDNMERAVSHAEQAPDVQAVATGVKMVVKQFQDVIGKLGVERVEAVGTPFDPNVHEAIQQIETKDQEPGTVVAELLAGYRWGERLLRASMVVVAKAPPAPPVVEQAEEPEAEAPSPDAPVASSDGETPSEAEER